MKRPKYIFDEYTVKKAYKTVVYEGFTLKELLLEQLNRLWVEGEGFSGKHPLGNSGWEIDVYYALCEEGLVSTAEKDVDGDWEWDEEQAEDLVLTCIRLL